MKNRPKRTLAESNPGWMARMLRKLRTNSPAPTSATVAKATSPMTSTLRVRREAAPAVSLRLPSFRTSFKLERNTNSAGAIPEINAAVTQAKAVNPRMRPFNAADVVMGSPMLGTMDSSDPCIHSSISRPATAPAAAAKLYEDAWDLVQKIGSGVDAEREQATAGLASVRLELARAAQRKGDYAEARTQVDDVLRVEPTNAAAIEFKSGNERLLDRKSTRL